MVIGGGGGSRSSLETEPVPGRPYPSAKWEHDPESEPENPTEHGRPRVSKAPRTASRHQTGEDDASGVTGRVKLERRDGRSILVVVGSDGSRAAPPLCSVHRLPSYRSRRICHLSASPQSGTMKCQALMCALVFLPVVAASIPARKCCQPDEKLHPVNATLGHLNCVPTNGNHLYSHFSVRHSVVYGIPEQCKQTQIVELSDKYFVTCVDNAEHFNRTIGIQCDQLPNFLFPAPRIDVLKKCCPKFRRYNSTNQSCWSGTKHPTVTGELIQVIFQNFTTGFVDLSFGAPACSESDVLVDMMVPKSNIWFQDSGSILMLPTGFKAPILVVPENLCVDFAEDHQDFLVVRACQDYKVVCSLTGHPCVRKCCKESESMFGANCQQSKSAPQIQFYELTIARDPTPIYGVHPAYSYGLECKKFPLDPSDNDFDQNFLLLNDSLYLPLQDKIVNSQSYCIEHIVYPSLGLNGTHSFLCLTKPYVAESKGIVNSPWYTVLLILMIMSSVCLLFTFVVYMYLPALHGSLHGKTLMSHVASLFAAYVCLTILQNVKSLSEGMCRFLGYFLQYSFLTAFAWLNVISFDIWWTFGTLRSSIFPRTDRLKRFMLYSLYGWGVPSLLTGVTVYVDYHPQILPVTWVPRMGYVSCFFAPESFGLILFFCGPISVTFIANVLLFILTARYCYQTRSRLEKLSAADPVRRKYSSDKSKLIVMGKLMVTMGLSWTLEMISRLDLLPPEAWYLSDLVNALQGFFIFITFVFKPQVLSGLASRLHPHQPSTSTMFTTATSDSRINTKLSIRTSQ